MPLETKIAENGYIKGMDQDSALSLRDPMKYYSLLNGQIVTKDGLSTGAVENADGNSISFKLPDNIVFNGATYSNMTIIGSLSIKDYLVLFTTSFNYSSQRPTNTTGQIWLLEINPSTGIPLPYGIVPITLGSSHIKYAGTLNFSTYNKIKAVGFYEDEGNLLVYFTDRYNVLRRINILGSNLLEKSVSSLSIVSSSEMSKPNIIGVTDSTSEYKVGMIEYAYQLYNLEGVATSFSPTSQLVPLAKAGSDTNATNTDSYYGGEQEDDSGKVIRVKIKNIDQSYSKIRVVSLHYNSINATPNITIVHEGSVSSSVEFSDAGGTSLGTMQYQEFAAIRNEFITSDIEQKDNILFAANINYNRFNIDDHTTSGNPWDSRAYRWNATGSSLRKFICGTQSNNNETQQYISNIDENADCIATKSNQYNYKYQYDGVTFGGTGSNVSYNFKVSSMVIGGNSNASMANAQGDQAWNIYIDGNYSPNDSFSGYGSPINSGQLKSYHRDEIYRFGIVFYNTKGQKSFVKWIGDIKFPAIYESSVNKVFSHSYYNVETYRYQHYIHSPDTNSVLALPIGLIFNIDTSDLDSDIVGYEVVRVKREFNDRTVLSQGLYSSLDKDDGSEYYRTYLTFNYRLTPATAKRTKTDSTYPVKIFSPEISFFKKNYIQSSFTLNIIGVTNDILNYFINPFEVIVKKVVGLSESSMFEDNRNYLIGDVSSSDVLLPFEGTTISNKYLRNQTDHEDVSGGTALFLLPPNGIDLDKTPSDASNARYYICNILNNDAIQYDGNTFNNRSLNEYIECGGYHKINTSKSTIYNGDVVIDYFDVLSGYSANSSTQSSGAVFIPVETIINLRYRNDESLHRSINTAISSESELYQYNDVFSKDSSATKLLAKPLNYDNTSLYESRIISSQQKRLGESVDSWSLFLTEDYIDVDTDKGAITALKNWKNRLFYFQENSIGIASVNERALYSGTTTAALSLGTGGVLDRYDYISSSSGTKYRDSVIDTNNGLYFFDQNKRSISSVTEAGSLSLTDKTGLSSYFNNLSAESFNSNNSIFAGKDIKEDRLYFSVNDGSKTHTACFNESLQAFESFISIEPRMYISTLKWLYTENGETGDVYTHGIGNKGEFYGESKPTELTVLVSDNHQLNKMFNTIEFNAREYGSDDGIWDSISFWDTTRSNTIPLVSGSNIKKRLSQWRFNGFRAYDLARMRDHHMFIKFSLSNQNKRRFRMYNLMTTYLFNVS